MTHAAQGTVYVVDDDETIRRALERLVRSVGLEVRSFASAREFLALESPAGPACVVLDVRMPGPSGLDLQQELARTGRGIPVIFMTGHGTVPMTVRAMKAGAVDFLEKPFDDQVLLDAVQRALERDRHALDERGVLDELRRRLASLTPREREVFERVVRGLLNKQIGAELGASEKTIKVHRGRVMRKMRARSVADLVRMAERAGIGAGGGEGPSP